MSKQKEVTVGEAIDELWDIREKIRVLNKQVEELDLAKKAQEAKLIALLKTQKVEQSRGAKATATLSKSIVPQVTDWDKAYAYILKSKSPWLLEKRMAATAFRETLESRGGKPIPGVESFEKESIALRTV